MPRLIIVLSLSLTALLLSGCESGNEPIEQATPVDKPKVLLVMKSLVNPFYIQMEQGARQAANELGVELIVRSGTNETLVEQQISLIDEQLAAGIDALVIAPADSIAILPVLIRANELGVKIVNIDNRIDTNAIQRAGLPAIPFVSVDNEFGGYEAGKILAELAGPDAKALIIEGPRSAINARERRDGARRALQENNIEVVASEVASWKLESAYALTQNVHARNPELNVIFAANDMMALGALLYAQEHGLNDWLIAGFDNIPDARAAVREGRLAVTIDQQADRQGYQGVATAVDLLNDKAVDDVVLVKTRVITADDNPIF
ncbi:substrate-binding domain-containing protein [Reinekea blandensis]|uniref:D-ribose-binding periplasmic protein n=1 Tax=Reinekea blandensis MED297 TaxID=314283 RepID=A4BF94_9GAMM|nr:substrate-binding domain-containing protein [Reinekea blandensis]EAR09207.1 D-ribose-binding periplasmic protein [Reinekea sp. MED297] [Reinekea blandensis MED297]